MLINFRYIIYRIGYISSISIICLYTFTIGLLLPVKLRMRITSLWNLFNSTWWLKVSAGIDCKVEGLENLPSEPFIAVANHQSEWETVFLCRLLQPVSIILKSSLFLIPLFGWALWLSNPIAINRKEPHKATRQIIKEGKKKLQQGFNLLIFPEGTRLPPTTIKTFSRTAAKLAIDTQTPIVPIIHNAGIYWGPGINFDKGTIQVRIEKPISPNGHSSTTLTKLLQQQVTEVFESLCRRP